MRVRAAMWYSSPCAIPDMLTYPSIKAVDEDFAAMVRDYERYGGAEPVGVIYPYDSDEPIYALSLGSRGGVFKEKL